MSLFTYRSVLVLLMALQGGCFPYRFTDAPAVAGKVVSRASGHPVAGAVVSMTRNKNSLQTYTDQNGHFSLPALQFTGLFIFGMQGYIPNGMLQIMASGYYPFTESGIGSPDSSRGGRTKRFGLSAVGIVSPDLQHIHVTLTPGA